MRVLFVCTANICRSAYAEVVTRALRLDGFEFQSAGVHGLRHKPMEELMAAEAVRRGADPSYFRSRALKTDMLGWADVVLTAETAHRRYVLSEAPETVSKVFSIGQFERGMVGARSMADVRQQAPTSTPQDDVDDPYGRGVGAAKAAAESLDRRLDPIISALMDLA